MNLVYLLFKVKFGEVGLSDGTEEWYLRIGLVLPTDMFH